MQHNSLDLRCGIVYQILSKTILFLLFIFVVTFGLDIIWFSWFNDESSVLNLLSRRDNSQSLRCSTSIQVAIALRE